MSVVTFLGPIFLVPISGLVTVRMGGAGRFSGWVVGCFGRGVGRTTVVLGFDLVTVEPGETFLVGGFVGEGFVIVFLSVVLSADGRGFTVRMDGPVRGAVGLVDLCELEDATGGVVVLVRVTAGLVGWVLDVDGRTVRIVGAVRFVVGLV